MTALPTAKRDALRYQIWAYASPRGWDVTVKEIAEALDESAKRVQNVVRQAGWNSRVRAGSAFGVDGVWEAGATVRGAERHVVRDVVAGRINAGDWPA